MTGELRSALGADRGKQSPLQGMHASARPVRPVAVACGQGDAVRGTASACDQSSRDCIKHESSGGTRTADRVTAFSYGICIWYQYHCGTVVCVRPAFGRCLEAMPA